MNLECAQKGQEVQHQGNGKPTKPKVKVNSNSSINGTTRARGSAASRTQKAAAPASIRSCSGVEILK